MTETTARFALPYILPGQAQKEVYHNEALALVDTALHPVAESLGDDVPPAGPQPGQCWITGTAPGGEWSGRAGQIAVWTAGGWRFVTPVEGMRVWLRGAGVHARWTGADWLNEAAADPAIADILGGNDARDAINAMLAVMRNHGLIEG